MLLLTLGLAGVGMVALADLPPRTLPSKPVKLPMLKSAGDIDGQETRPFHVGGREYRAVLRHREIEASPEWSSSSALPMSLGGIEAAAHAQLNKLVTDSSEWEISNIALNRLSDSERKWWYYAVTFIPVLRLTGFPSDEVVVMLTIDGKPGHSFEFRSGLAAPSDRVVR